VHRSPSPAAAQDAGPAASSIVDTTPAGGAADVVPTRSQPSAALTLPRPVYVGVYLNAIPSLDLEGNRYLVDFYLWFRWQGDDIIRAAPSSS